MEERKVSIEVSDSEVQVYIKNKRPDTWHLGWTRIEYENAYKEILEHKRRAAVIWCFENYYPNSEED